MNETVFNRNGWGLAMAVSVTFNLALLGVMTHMRALIPQRTEFEAVRIAFLPETESLPSVQPPSPRPRSLPQTASPQPVTAETGTLEQLPAPAETPPAPARDIQPLHRLSQVPRFLQRIDPAYPEAERVSGREAHLVVEVVVDIRGRVLEASIVQSGGPHFDQAALDAVKQSLFVPGYIDGQAVVVRFQIPFRFQLR